MPIKRRTEKARRRLESTDLEDLFYGPGTCLFNGEGYLAPHGDGLFRDKSEHVQGEVLAKMRADWERHSEAVLQAWLERDEQELRLAERHHGNPAHPWALIQFGDPRCQ
jgi:hypothetical protein